MYICIYIFIHLFIYVCMYVLPVQKSRSMVDVMELTFFCVGEGRRGIDIAWYDVVVGSPPQPRLQKDCNIEEKEGIVSVSIATFRCYSNQILDFRNGVSSLRSSLIMDLITSVSEVACMPYRK